MVGCLQNLTNTTGCPLQSRCNAGDESQYPGDADAVPLRHPTLGPHHLGQAQRNLKQEMGNRKWEAGNGKQETGKSFFRDRQSRVTVSGRVTSSFMYFVCVLSTGPGIFRAGRQQLCRLGPSLLCLVVQRHPLPTPSGRCHEETNPLHTRIERKCRETGL